MGRADLSAVPINHLFDEIRDREALHDEDIDGIVDDDVMSHALCVRMAAEYMRKRAEVVLPEFFTHNAELPDVIAFNSRCSTVIECKVSRSDFLKDRFKSFRVNPNSGMGDYRYYCAPKGLIRHEELPIHWGLIEILPGNKIRKAVDCYTAFKKNIDAELYLRWII